LQKELESGSFVLVDGTMVDAAERFDAIATDTYFIVPNKSTEYQGFHKEPQCVTVCPVDCCVPDEAYIESSEQLQSLLYNKKYSPLVGYSYNILIFNYLFL
jgi:hypothetical protein